MAKYIKKKALKDAIDNCTWYHINKDGELVEGANPADHEPLYKYSDIKKIIKGLPTKKITEQTEPQFDKDINVRSKYKQGTWLYGDGVYCSCCGYKLETTALLAKCPKCGADMSKTDCAWK